MPFMNCHPERERGSAFGGGLQIPRSARDDSFVEAARARAINDCIAIIDINAIIDCMASITIRQLEETTKRKLRLRAAKHGRSMEEEAREILKTAVNQPEEQPDLGEAIRRRFAKYGGVDLKIPPREPMREPPIR
jgi:antitoxin FitA